MKIPANPSPQTRDAAATGEHKEWFVRKRVESRDPPATEPVKRQPAAKPKLPRSPGKVREEFRSIGGALRKLERNQQLLEHWLQNIEHRYERTTQINPEPPHRRLQAEVDPPGAQRHAEREPKPKPVAPRRNPHQILKRG